MQVVKAFRAGADTVMVGVEVTVKVNGTTAETQPVVLLLTVRLKLYVPAVVAGMATFRFPEVAASVALFTATKLGKAFGVVELILYWLGELEVAV